jgi:hypothetical protein
MAWWIFVLSARRQLLTSGADGWLGGFVFWMIRDPNAVKGEIIMSGFHIVRSVWHAF